MTIPFMGLIEEVLKKIWAFIINKCRKPKVIIEVSRDCMDGITDPNRIYIRGKVCIKSGGHLTNCRVILSKIDGHLDRNIRLSLLEGANMYWRGQGNHSFQIQKIPGPITIHGKSEEFFDFGTINAFSQFPNGGGRTDGTLFLNLFHGNNPLAERMPPGSYKLFLRFIAGEKGEIDIPFGASFVVSDMSGDQIEIHQFKWKP